MDYSLSDLLNPMHQPDYKVLTFNPCTKCAASPGIIHSGELHTRLPPSYRYGCFD